MCAGQVKGTFALVQQRAEPHGSRPVAGPGLLAAGPRNLRYHSAWAALPGGPRHARHDSPGRLSGVDAPITDGVVHTLTASVSNTNVRSRLLKL